MCIALYVQWIIRGRTILNNFTGSRKKNPPPIEAFSPTRWGCPSVIWQFIWSPAQLHRKLGCAHAASAVQGGEQWEYGRSRPSTSTVNKSTSSLVFCKSKIQAYLFSNPIMFQCNTLLYVLKTLVIRYAPGIYLSRASVHIATSHGWNIHCTLLSPVAKCKQISCDSWTNGILRIIPLVCNEKTLLSVISIPAHLSVNLFQFCKHLMLAP